MIRPLKTFPMNWLSMNNHCSSGSIRQLKKDLWRSIRRPPRSMLWRPNWLASLCRLSQGRRATYLLLIRAPARRVASTSERSQAKAKGQRHQSKFRERRRSIYCSRCLKIRLFSKSGRISNTTPWFFYVTGSRWRRSTTPCCVPLSSRAGPVSTVWMRLRSGIWDYRPSNIKMWWARERNR